MHSITNSGGVKKYRVDPSQILSLSALNDQEKPKILFPKGLLRAPSVQYVDCTRLQDPTKHSVQLF
jgi:hypothetical protein